MNVSYAQAASAIQAIQDKAPAAYQQAYNSYLAYVTSWAHTDMAISAFLLGLGIFLLIVGIAKAVFKTSDFDDSPAAFIIPAVAMLVIGTILYFQGHMSLLNARVTALNDLLNALIPHAGGN